MKKNWKIDVRALAENNFIQYYESGYKQCSRGWIQFDCPFCTGNPGPHLGYNIRSGYFKCWRCGFQPTVATIKALTGLQYHEARQLVRKYNVKAAIEPHSAKNVRAGTGIEQKWPPEACIMPHTQRQYLLDRGFDSDKLIRDFHLHGSKPIGNLKYRIIVPIYWKDMKIGFQGRTVAGAEPKWKAWPHKEDWTVPQKNTLYGHDWTGNSVIVTEGAPDVWRLGKGNAVATFGQDVIDKQIQALADFDVVYVMFDPEETAQKKAKQLAMELSLLDIEAEVVDLEYCDPGDLEQSEADAIVEELLTK